MEAKLACHYTIEKHLSAIIETGSLLPSIVDAKAGTELVLWFSLNQECDNAARVWVKQGDEFVAFRRWMLTETDGDVIRFGVDPEKLIPWPQVAKVARIMSDEETLIRDVISERILGISPWEWMGFWGQLSIAECEAIEIFRGGSWTMLFEEKNPFRQ